MASAKRVTIMIDHELDKKVRLLQSKMITKTNGTYSFSRVVGELIENGIQHYKGKKRT
jgi:hypothetical protein